MLRVLAPILYHFRFIKIENCNYIVNNLEIGRAFAFLVGIYSERSCFVCCGCNCKRFVNDAKTRLFFVFLVVYIANAYILFESRTSVYLIETCKQTVNVFGKVHKYHSLITL
jgi:hypothetical protein